MTNGIIGYSLLALTVIGFCYLIFSNRDTESGEY